MAIERDGKFMVYVRGADNKPKGRSRGTYTGDDAKDQAAEQLDNLRTVERGEQQNRRRYNGLDLTPPSSVRAACQRGLDQEGGTALQRQAAELITSGSQLSVLAIRTVARQFNKSRKSGDDQQHLLRGGDAGAVWFKTMAAALDNMDSGVKSAKEVGEGTERRRERDGPSGMGFGSGGDFRPIDYDALSRESSRLQRMMTSGDLGLPTALGAFERTVREAASFAGGSKRQALSRAADDIEKGIPLFKSPMPSDDNSSAMSPHERGIAMLKNAFVAIRIVASAKAITASNASGAGFSIPPDDDGLGATVSMRKGMEVYVKSTGEIGTVRGVKRVGDGVRYKVETPSGFTICSRKGIMSARAKAIKEAVVACDTIQKAADAETVDAETVKAALKALATSWKIADMSTREKMQTSYDALIAARAILTASPDESDLAKKYLAMAKAGLDPIAEEGVKASYDNGVKRAVQLLQMVRASLSVDSQPQRLGNVRLLNKVDGLLSRLLTTASPNGQRVFRGIQETLSRFTDNEESWDPAQTPISEWEQGISDALRQMIAFAGGRGIKAEGEVEKMREVLISAYNDRIITGDESKQLDQLRHQTKNPISDLDYFDYSINAYGTKPEYLAKRKKVLQRLNSIIRKRNRLVDEINQRAAKPQTKNTVTAALKALQDVVGEITTAGASTDDQQERMLEAVDTLHLYAAAAGEKAIKSLEPLEEALYAEPDDGLSEWQQRVVSMIEDYQAKIASEPEPEAVT